MECPKCKQEYDDHPAISRDDNKTEICPACGLKEALAAAGLECKVSDEELGKIIKAVRNPDQAVTTVNDRIKRYTAVLQQYVDNKVNEPVMLEGQTTTGYYCQMMIDPKEAAEIMLEYDYPTWACLHQDAPDEMWEALGRKFGLETACSVDI